MERLQRERTVLLSELRTVREQVETANSYANDHAFYSGEANLQANRLETMSAFENTSNNSCPFCRSPLGEEATQTAPLREAIVQLRVELGAVERSRSAVEEMIGKLESRESELRSQLNLNRSALNSLLEQIQSLAANRDLDMLRAQVFGRIQLYLESERSLRREAGSEEMELLKSRASQLEQKLGDENIAQTLDAQLQIISREIEQNAIQLELGFSKSPLRLNVETLKLEAATPRGLVRMADFGGGSNYMGYHIAVHMALHKFFIDQQRPVPHFLVLDQPTQVFYPPDLPKGADVTVDDFTDEDRVKARRLFIWLDNYLTKLNAMQVIVCDHADIQEPWFQAKVIDKWRGAKALVPYEWMQ
jgi:hypothetical protein